MSFTKSEILALLTRNKGTFSGVLDVSEPGTSYYDDYSTGSVVNFSLSATKVKGSITTVRIKGSLTGAIPTSWLLSGAPISYNSTKFNEITVLYVSDEDVRLVNRVISYPDIEAPTVPSSLASSSITQTACHLAWTASTDNVAVTGYKIYQDGVYVKTVTTNSANISNGITASTTYAFTVSAIDAAGNESAQSTALNVTTLAQAGMTYDTDYQALMDYATTNSFELPSDSQKLIDNQKIINLKAEGIWAELDVFYDFKKTYTPSSWAVNFYRLNWKSPGTYTLGKDTNEPAYVSGTGYKNVIGSSYLKTGFVPSTNGIKITTSSSSVIFGINNYTSGTAYFCGGRVALGDTEQTIIGPGATLNDRFFSGNGVGYPTVANFNGHYHIAHATTTMYDFKDGESISTIYYASPVLTTVEIYLFAVNANNSGITGSGTTFGIEYFTMGSDLTSKQDKVFQIMKEIY